MKTWLITGCSTGFGKELAKHALEKGDAVVATARKVESLDDLEGEVLKVALDVTDTKSIAAAVKEAKAWKGKIDVLVNNAGFGNVGTVEETSDETYRKMFDVNVFGVVNVLREVLPVMREQKSGHVINISSVAGIVSMAGLAPYCASKHAVEALTEGLLQEVGPLGIKVTAIEPGAFKTKFVSNVIYDDMHSDYDETAGQMKEMVKSFEENAPGDPQKAAEVMYAVAGMKEPPLRLLIGNDALGWANEKIDALKQQANAHTDLTTSTDFDQ